MGTGPLKLPLLSRRSAPALRPGSTNFNRDWYPALKVAAGGCRPGHRYCFYPVAGDQAGSPGAGRVNGAKWSFPCGFWGGPEKENFCQECGGTPAGKFLRTRPAPNTAHRVPWETAVFRPTNTWAQMGSPDQHAMSYHCLHLALSAMGGPAGSEGAKDSAQAERNSRGHLPTSQGSYQRYRTTSHGKPCWSHWFL